MIYKCNKKFNPKAHKVLRQVRKGYFLIKQGRKENKNFAPSRLCQQLLASFKKKLCEHGVYLSPPRA